MLLPKHLEAQLWQQAYAAWPQECLGLLAGSVDSVDSGDLAESGGTAEIFSTVTAIQPLGNVAECPTTQYAADPIELLRLLKSWRRQGLDWLAQYHSHPRGLAWPSASDLAQAVEVPQIIVSLEQQKLAVFIW